MKKSALILFLILLLSGCGGGGRGNNEIGITLTGTVSQGAVSGGQGNPVPSATVTIPELNKSDEITQTDGGRYAISGIPIGGTFTVRVTDPNTQTVDVTCGITIPNSTTLTVTSNSTACSVGTSSGAGELVLNITI
ncbi:MAG: hypothetical protein WAO55_14760 [Candidatus Manganitrophaceae bacterium]